MKTVDVREVVACGLTTTLNLWVLYRNGVSETYGLSGKEDFYTLSTALKKLRDADKIRLSQDAEFKSEIVNILRDATKALFSQKEESTDSTGD